MYIHKSGEGAKIAERCKVPFAPALVFGPNVC